MIRKIVRRKKFAFLLLFVFLVSGIRLIYWRTYPHIFVNADTDSYYRVGQKIIGGQILIDDLRSPLYPLFLMLPALLNNRPETAIYSPSFYRDMTVVILAQSLLGLLSLLLTFRLAKKLGFSPAASYFFALFMGLNIMVFSMERLLLTETLCGFIVLMFANLLLSILNSYRPSKLFLMGLVAALLFLTKPVYFLLPLPVVMLLLLRYGKKFLFHGFLWLLSAALMTAGYIYLNFLNYGYTGLSRAGEIGLLGKIIIYKLDISPANNNYYYPFLKQYLAENRETHPFRFMDFALPFYWDKKEKMNQLVPLVRSVILHNFPDYITKTLREIPYGITEANNEVILSTHGTRENRSIIFLYETYRYLQYSLLAIIPIALWQVRSFFRKKNAASSKWLAVSLLALYHILLTVFIDYGEFGRVLSISQVFSYLTVLYLLRPAYQ
ncbi:MAG: hypothetical protein UV73_C0005G0082 [Candidatus Gottesmanbacteria bacterium GW2011_GWA2_43_14]|uniref:Glycosyltransferase RgtA/B/C/D-like domain-containing protein n=1 Tax=Candidatus Gottesmanbacteria bacterium GW2011_GWA2_43_14 TaxID=1618443 RepID=A0A0G1DIY2_9BACT|nr:MAG: hypothetical protein UV73_C0005G0082 [Candidatus Gottesmanbacteria bacterium GW2011_GWA2_43_14]